MVLISGSAETRRRETVAVARVRKEGLNMLMMMGVEFCFVFIRLSRGRGEDVSDKRLIGVGMLCVVSRRVDEGVCRLSIRKIC